MSRLPVTAVTQLWSAKRDQFLVKPCDELLSWTNSKFRKFSIHIYMICVQYLILSIECISNVSNDSYIYWTKYKFHCRIHESLFRTLACLFCVIRHDFTSYTVTRCYWVTYRRGKNVLKGWNRNSVAHVVWKPDVTQRSIWDDGN